MKKFESFLNRNEVEQIKKFSLDGLSIKSVSEKPVLEGRLSEIDWPIELQGKGTTSIGDKTMEVKYPKGDVILSFVTIIHELGHLGQEQIDPSLKVEKQTYHSLLAQEKDAWRRGWNRLVTVRPDIREFLQGKLDSLSEKGDINFKTIDSFYYWVQENVLKIVEEEKILFESDDNTPKSRKDRFDKLADKLKNIGIDNFFKQYNTIRVNEQVNEKQVNKFIQDIAESVMAELNEQ